MAVVTPLAIGVVEIVEDGRVVGVEHVVVKEVIGVVGELAPAVTVMEVITMTMEAVVAMAEEVEVLHISGLLGEVTKVKTVAVVSETMIKTMKTSVRVSDGTVEAMETVMGEAVDRGVVDEAVTVSGSVVTVEHFFKSEFIN